MQISQVTITYSRTQSLGNYSNVKPGVTLTAVIDAQDDFDKVEENLLIIAKGIVHDEIDSALEADGSEPLFFKGPLFSVHYANMRNVVVVHPESEPLPEYDNWKERDPWHRDHRLPRRMRLETAMREGRLLSNEKQLLFRNCIDGDYKFIPTLPDPGPEPAWSKNGLRSALLDLKIPMDYWDEIGELEHIDNEMLRSYYRFGLEREELEFRLDVIRNNRDWPQDKPDDEEEEWDDDDYDEDDD